MTKALKKFFPVFAGPTLLAFMIAFIVPFFMGLYLSFTKFNSLTNARFVGTDNYARALGERSDFPQALLFTAVVSVISIITVNLGAFALAYFLTRKLRGTNFFRAVFFMPNLMAASSWATPGRSCSTRSCSAGARPSSTTGAWAWPAWSCSSTGSSWAT